MCGKQIVHHPAVSGQPVDTTEMVFPQPARILGLQKLKVTGKDMADIAVHREMESRIVVLHRHDKLVDRDLCVQLLTYLAPQCVLTAFALLNFAAGKLPPVFPLAIAALRGKHQTVAADNGSHHFYMLHVLYINRYNPMQSYKEYPAFQSPLPYDFAGIAVFDRKPFDKRPSTQTFILEKKLGFF